MGTWEKVGLNIIRAFESLSIKMMMAHGIPKKDKTRL